MNCVNVRMHGATIKIKCAVFSVVTCSLLHVYCGSSTENRIACASWVVVEDSFSVLVAFYLATWHYILQIPNLYMRFM